MAGGGGGSVASDPWFPRSGATVDPGSHPPFVMLPGGFTQLRNLTVLGLNDMSLTNLPYDFGW
ncbi:Protein lap4 [Portunus trituberculatus]|uniref:Protein lap4 n=1 Tax=Portunus trituberculatus TaxID=210409 RepID=A0A5B7IDP1_PORTR|nr:Protein lap4 [Portunus trituberculatus]